MSKNSPAIHILIAAAGTGSRMNEGETPKQYLPLAGKPILRHSIDKLSQLDNIKSLTVIIHPDHGAYFEQATADLERIQRVHGNESRKQSIYNGLQNLIKVKNDNDLVLIHDAARPFFCINKAKEAIDIAYKNRSSSLAHKIVDTLYHDQDKTTLSRDHIWAIQTPQIFKADLILKAHEELRDNDSFTDDRGIVEALGHSVSLVESSAENFKITTQEDYERAKAIVRTNMQTRTAIGFDVHAFEEGNNVRLGGIDIPHDKSLKGHSDADVVLHAITDAILGTINEGDIGTHFPPSDPQWKNADSALFLTEAIKMLNNKGGHIDFIDVTIMAEEPKIGPHREAIQKRIAETTRLAPKDISIKATTTEGLGFTGRKEGIACQCAVTINIERT